MKYTITGYGIIVIGLALIMLSTVAASVAGPLAVLKSKALMSFGGFLIALGFITSSCFSKDSDNVRAGMAIASAIIVAGTMMLI